MNGRHRNTGWTSGLAVVPPDTPPAFERFALELGLTAPTYVESGDCAAGARTIGTSTTYPSGC
jgi:hypothetical protein